MLESETTTINGRTYEVTKLPYKLGKKILLILYRTVGPAAAEALAKAPEGNLADIQVRHLAPAFSAAVGGLAERLEEKDFDLVVDTMAQYTKISKEGASNLIPLKGEIEFHFSGNYGELFKWLGFALRVNYSGFSGEHGSLADVLQKVKAVAKASQSQNISTGMPTESPQASDTAAG